MSGPQSGYGQQNTASFKESASQAEATVNFSINCPVDTLSGKSCVREVFTPGTAFVIKANEYHIDHCIAEGGYGVVFAISDASTGKPFAAKIVPRNRAESIIVETLVLARMHKESLAPSKHVFAPMVFAAAFAMAKGHEFAILIMERAVGSLQDHCPGGSKKPLKPEVPQFQNVSSQVQMQ